MPVPVPVPVPSLLPPEMQAHVRVQMQMRLPDQDYPACATPAPEDFDYRKPEPEPELEPAYRAPAPAGNTELALAPALPPAAAVNLLNSLLVFYQHERNWVHRTRASIELALVQAPLLVVPRIGSPRQQSAGAQSGASTNEPTPATPSDDDREQDQDRAEDIVKKEEDLDDAMDLSLPAGPLTLRATQRARAPASRWLKRKKSFKLHLGPLSARLPSASATAAARARARCHPADDVEPGTQLLALFGELVDARMESCLRITQLIRNSNRSMLHA